MVKTTGEAALRTTSPPQAPPPPPPLPPPPTCAPLPRLDQATAIKRNLNFLNRATQQSPSPPQGATPPGVAPGPGPGPASTSPPPPPPPPPPAQVTQAPSPGHQEACYVAESSWTTFKSHFPVVAYPPPGYKTVPATFPCPPPPLGHVDVKPPAKLPPPIRRPVVASADPPLAETAASFEFALEAEKMVSELCSSTPSKDFADNKYSAVDANRFELCERRRQAESWPMKPRQVRPHDIQHHNQPLRITIQDDNVNSKLETGLQLPCIYEDDLFLRDFIVKGCIDLENVLKGLKRSSQFSDLLGFCRIIRENAENPSTYELHYDEARSQIITYFRVASCWLSIYPLLERSSMQRDERRSELYQSFNGWQIASRRMMEIIVKNVPLLKERLDSDGSVSDALAFGDQAYKRHPPQHTFTPMHYDTSRTSADNLKRQRSVPNVQGHHRHWRQRRFSDNHNENEGHGWPRNNPPNPKDVNNRQKWTIVSPEMYHPHKPPPHVPFRKPDMHSPINYQDNCDSQPNRYRPKVHPPECIPSGRAPVLNHDHDKMSKWLKYHTYPPMELEEGQDDDGNQSMAQEELVQHNHVVLLSQIEPRCAQKHNDQQPVDLDALFQGYRVANEVNPEKAVPSVNRQVCKVPPNQGQLRYGCHDAKLFPPHNRGRRWYSNYNYCPPPWVSNANYDQDSADDPHEGVYMKPGSYDVPKRDVQKTSNRQFTAPPPPLPVLTSPNPSRFKAVPPDEVTWKAALASAETLCKSLRSNDGHAPQSIVADAQQQWMLRAIRSSSSSETDEGEARSRPGDDSEGAAASADVATAKSVAKKVKNARERKSLTKGSTATPPPPPASSSPLSPSPPATTSPAQPPSARHRRLSPSASRKLQRFLETVWAVKEASHIKFSPDQEHGGIDDKKVLEDTFQRLLDDGWATGGAVAAAAAAAAAAAVSRRQTNQ